MNQIKFGIRFTINQYAYGELDNFIECSDNIDSADLAKRYVDFLNALICKKIKPSTLVDVDVLQLFADDLKNRVNIDYLEGHWDDEPHIVAGGKMFLRTLTNLKLSLETPVLVTTDKRLNQYIQPLR